MTEVQLVALLHKYLDHGRIIVFILRGGRKWGGVGPGWDVKHVLDSQEC